MKRRLSTILAADVVGYSRLMEADEEATVRTLSAYLKSIDSSVTNHNGRVFGSAGDSVMAEFASPVEAVRCAINIQHELNSISSDVPVNDRMRFRIGINLGDVIVEGDNLLGDGVNIAARLESIADPGGITLSRSMYDQVRKTIALQYEDMGKQNLKNIAESVHAYRIVMGNGVQHSVREYPELKISVKPSIAVLPFSNMSNEAEQVYFSDGLTEDIITELSRFHDLHIVARHSSFAYKGKSIDTRVIGQELDVQYLVEGSVRKSGNLLRVTAQLIDSVTGHHLWVERYDGKLVDVFAVQDDITEKIVSALAIKVEDDALKRSKRKRTGHQVAYDYVLRGDAVMMEFTREGSVLAKQLYQKAIQIDPSYARAYIGIAFSYLSDWGFLLDTTPDVLDRAVEFARKAVALDDTESRSHWVLAYVLTFHRDYKEARAHQKKAIAMNPNDADIISKMGYVLPLLGESEEAIELGEKAARLNPHHPDWYKTFLGFAYYSARRYEEAIDAFEESGPVYPEDKVWLAAAYAQLGENDKANKLTELFFKDAGPEPWWKNLPLTVERIEGDSTSLLTYMSYMYPFKDQDDLDHLLNGLRMAGVPK
jgi:adenylate cyclase